VNVMSAQSRSPDIRDWEARAVDALEDARAMPTVQVETTHSRKQASFVYLST
jgi:hypothetical protein